MDTQQSRHVVLEDTPSDLVTPPVLPVQMPATQTLEQRIRQMRDPDEMISWDDPDDVPVATLPVGFRMPDIERYTGVGCPPADTEMVRFIRVISSENLGGLSTGVSETGEGCEMIERPTERDQMSMFLRSLHPRFARHLTGVPFQDFRSLVQALFDVDDGISRGLWSDIIPSSDTEGRELVDHLRAMETYVLRTFSIDDLVIIPMRDHCRYPGVISHLYSIVILIQFSSTLLCILMLSRAFERLRSTGVLVPLAPRPLPSTLPPRFRAHEFCAFHQMAGHRTDYCASLRHTIQDLIDSEHIEIRLLQLRHPSSSRGAPGVAMPSLPHLTSSTPATLGASHPRSRPHSVFQQHSSSISLATPTRPPPQFRGPPVVTVPQDRFPPHRRCRRHFSDLSAPLSRVFEMFQAMGFLAPLAPRALPDPVPPQFRLDLYCAYHQSVGHHTDRCTALRHAIQDIVDSGTFGHPQSDMFPIPTSAQAMHADAPSPAVPDLIDWAIDS
ncbi:hypothetical protein CK203_083690 [Vitis vinifera]|uniref:Retrotransposon gag domain-containing protein n=1 Tax=Vitis vinifera TaxID=29760 RepID=A0A438CYE9_VITVI|nr:hypothetical protein CK203_083690 [Vitis vinifera]